MYVSEKFPICMLSRSKAPERSKFSITDIREKPVGFFTAPHGRRFQLPKSVTNLGSLAKFFVPVESIIPWLSFGKCKSISTVPNILTSFTTIYSWRNYLLRVDVCSYQICSTIWCESSYGGGTQLYISKGVLGPTR